MISLVGEELNAFHRCAVTWRALIRGTRLSVKMRNLGNGAGLDAKMVCMVGCSTVVVSGRRARRLRVATG
jgi:hypothetical protein